MDRGAWQAIVHGVAKSQTLLSAHTSAGMDCSLSPPPRWAGSSGVVSQGGRVSWYPGYLSIYHPAALTSGSLLGQQMEEQGLDKRAVSHLSGLFSMRPRCKGVSIMPCLTTAQRSILRE